MRIPIAAWALMAALLPGCITVGGRDDDAPPDAFHVVDVSAPAKADPAAARALPGKDQVLAVRPFRSPDRFDRHVVRLDAPGRITPMEHDFWADEPSRAVTDAVREAITGSRGFAAVVDPADANETHVILDGTIREFAWMPGSPSKAVVRLRFTWSEARTGRVTSTRLHEATQDLPGPGTDGLGPAMAEAVRRAAIEALAAHENSVTPAEAKPVVR